MPSLLDKIVRLWPENGVLASSSGQRVALGIGTSLLAVIPFAFGHATVTLLAHVVLISLLVYVGGLYLKRNEHDVWARLRDLVILATLVLGVVYGTWISTVLLPGVPPYVLPVALAPVLATLLLNPRVGMLIAVVGVGVGVLFGMLDGAHVVGSLLASAAGVTAMGVISERSRLISAGGLVVTVTGGAALGATLVEGGTLQAASVAGGMGLVGGAMTVILMLGLLPVFEFVFGVTTDVRLLELANPGNALLKRLMMEAPGTYSHSVMTGNLAEAAAESIGADALLTRVGAYYHDIGKIRRPGFFVENQAGGHNPHDNTTPALSALIITAHVREGVELAEEYRLPHEVIEIVKQHHGTSMVMYFYNKAAAGGGPVFEADFRYAGERPSSREAALIMLADSAEAAVRAVVKPTPPRIEETVRKVIAGKLADHQLDLANLTLAEIENITAVYSRMLASVYHPRIDYNDMMVRKERHAGQHHEPSRA
ncbi:MAG: HDIG domain-containing protein [Actinomycetota bacterium]|nr:HDIG domain-containing protein [Actinomycetota bacterium]